MAAFGIHFFLSNLLLSLLMALFLFLKRTLRPYLTARMQFRLWYLFSGLFAAPFLSFSPPVVSQIFAWSDKLTRTFLPTRHIPSSFAAAENASAIDCIRDYAISINGKTPSIFGFLLCALWLAGVAAALLLTIRAHIRFHVVRQTALPLQNRDIRALYDACLAELGIQRTIPLYSTAFLKSPILTGLFRPRIYLPIHLISNVCRTGPGTRPTPAKELRPIRYILLHELQHYRHKDAFSSGLMHLLAIAYWHNPLIWHALREMQTDREIACDASVLHLLEENEYEAYGDALLYFAKTVSRAPFPFAAAAAGSLRQLKKRMLHIAAYKKPSAIKISTGLFAFFACAILFLPLAFMLSRKTSAPDRYAFSASAKNISLLPQNDSNSLSTYFNGYEGSFVLYDSKRDAWTIYNIDAAALRTAPESTYKIYDALFGLEEGVITPGHSFMAWDGVPCPFDAWNADQTLPSAMRDSVNWYFEKIDEKIGASAIKRRIQQIGYGNESPTDDAFYWMQSDLKISPIEQVLLLARLYDNRLDCSPEHIQAVKDSLYLSSSGTMRLYGKTGTGRIDGRDVNGWFVGYTEDPEQTHFFAVNIQSNANATGSRAANIALSILSDLHLWTL